MRFALCGKPKNFSKFVAQTKTQRVEGHFVIQGNYTLMKSSKGFTIIELMIAIFILSIGVIGIYSAFSIIVILTADSSDSFTATYLAQEAMEVVRNIRDQNWIIGQDWQSGLVAYCAAAGGCQVDYKTDFSSVQPYDSNAYLKIDANGFYNYPSGIKTKFKRKITMTCITGAGVADNNLCGSDHIMKFSVQVYWDKKPNILNRAGCSAGDAGCGSVTIEEYFYNWF